VACALPPITVSVCAKSGVSKNALYSSGVPMGPYL
jgi:hypothetical protein